MEAAAPTKTIDIVIPAFNEEGNIARAIETLFTRLAPLPYRFELIVVDDGSRDRTAEIAAGFVGRHPVRVVRLTRNFGKENALLAGLAPLHPRVNGAIERAVPYIINLSLPGIEAEAAIDAWAPHVAISTGAACTSQSYTCSHVLSAMGLDGWRAENALRFSWTATSQTPDWSTLVSAAASLQAIPGAP